MRETRPYGSVRGAPGNGRPYRDSREIALRAKRMNPSSVDLQAIALEPGAQVIARTAERCLIGCGGPSNPAAILGMSDKRFGVGDDV